jgi:NADH-quinone oxidoreductase subunit N
MFFDLTNNFINMRDVSAYAAELTLLFGILFLLLHLTFLNTTIKYPTLIEYSSRVSVFVLLLVQTFNLKCLCSSVSSLTHFSFFHGALISSYEIVFFKTILIFLAILILLVSETYFKETKLGYFEYNILFLSSVLGCLLTLSANDLMVFYISLEIQALSFYIMATMKKSAISSEAGLKYFVIGSFSSALLLFGVSLIVLLTGHHNFESINLSLIFPDFRALPFGGLGAQVADSLEWQIQSIGLVFGILLIITALLIKLAVAPFHEWVADVYEGIPTPTALFFATIPKISNFFILVRLVQNVFESLSDILQPFLILICLLSLILGSLNAFKQQNIKRFLAFSSVNHFGFILLGLIVGTKAGIAASFFYLAFYIVLTFGMWTSLILLTYVKSGKDLQLYQLTRITELGGLVNSNPSIAFAIFLMLVSMGGVPPLAGFNAKVGVFFVLIERAFTLEPLGGWLSSLLILVVVVALLSSVLSVFYYIRVIKILTFVSKVHTTKNPIIFKLKKRGVVGIYVLAFITSFNLFSFLLFFV